MEPQPSHDPEQYRAKILGYLARLTRRQATAEDLTQEVFLRVHNNLSSLREEASLKAWIYRIASNVFFDHRRRASTEMEDATEELGVSPAWQWDEEGARTPDEVEIEAEQATCIRQYVDALPESYRAVLVMHDMEGLTNPEIAEVLGCSLATAKIRLHRARKKLREAMDRGCDVSQDEHGSVVCDPKTGKGQGCGS